MQNFASAKFLVLSWISLMAACQPVQQDLAQPQAPTGPVVNEASAGENVQSVETLPSTRGISLATPFASHMVLQRDRGIKVWGWGSPGTPVKLSLDGQQVEARVNASGQWSVDFPPHTAGGPYQLCLEGEPRRCLDDVWVGEVWLASGQSNMEWPVDLAKDPEKEIAAANHPMIRILQIEHQTSTTRKPVVPNSGWQVVTPQNIPKMTAVGYYFARELERELQVPIGIVQSTWGGTPAEAWTSAEQLTKLDDYKPWFVAAEGQAPLIQESDEVRMARWLDEIESKASKKPKRPSYELASYNDKAWKTAELPGYWEEKISSLKEYNGTVWYRRQIELPADFPAGPAKLELGPIDDADRSWINDQVVGMTRKHTKKRSYDVRPGILKPGPNTIVVQAVDFWGTGGFSGKAEEMSVVASDGRRFSLAGTWKYKAGVDFQKTKDLPRLVSGPHVPSALFNGMIEPILPLSIRGVIWYQGESNADRAHQYRELFPAMIQDWRYNFGQGDLPFFFVQLANFMAPQKNPAEKQTWPELREAQREALKLPRTGMAVTLDIGNATDIHPKNKQEVGRRLSTLALADVYDRQVIKQGPLFQNAEVEGSKIRIRFSDIGGGLVAKDGELKGFAIAGKNKKFRWAKATIENDTVVVSHPKIKKPIAVRYAWGDNPVMSLFNAEGFPASSFATDDWPWVTEK